MTLQMYIVAWTTTVADSGRLEDHWMACDSLEQAKDLYSQLENDKIEAGTVLRTGEAPCGIVPVDCYVKHLALCAPMVSEIYPCTDVVVWNQSKGTDTLDNLRFDSVNCVTGLHIYPQKEIKL